MYLKKRLKQKREEIQKQELMLIIPLQKKLRVQLEI
jgi:hypothetical protein